MAIIPGMRNMKQGRILKKPAAMVPRRTCNDLGVVLAGLLSEHTLYDVLVSTPIPETDDGCSEEHHVTGIFRIHRVALISMEHVVDAVAVVHGAGIVHHC